MNKPSLDLLAGYHTNQGQSVLFGHLIIVGMMMAVAAAFALAGERLFQDWRGGYLVFISLLVALEAIYTRSRVRDLETRERIIFHASEWVAFAVALKVLLYVLHNPAELLQDLPRWQENFLESFFTAEYLLALLIIILVWFTSKAFAAELQTLYEREEDAVWDELGKLQNALHESRGKIASRVFIMGTLVVILAVISRIDATFLLRTRGQATAGYNAPVMVVLVYFVLALFLLSQTQFALLRARWLWQRLPISPRLSANWLKYGLLFFLVLGGIVFLLPTEYSLGLFDTLRYTLNYLIQFLTFLLFLVTLPFTLCLSLFNATNPEKGVQPNAPLPPAPPPVVAQGQPIAWLEFLRSLIFWGIFLAVIFFALRYYFSQNAALWNAIVKFPLFRWIAAIGAGIWGWIKGANRQVSGLVRGGIQRLRRQRVAMPTQVIRRMFNLSRMSPRDKIVYFYLNLVQLGGERGLSRRPSETPAQYDARLSRAVPEIDSELHGLTDEFIEARYSRHPVEPPLAEQAGSLWERIKAVLRNWKRPDER